jgi:hypothetical protein
VYAIDKDIVGLTLTDDELDELDGPFSLLLPPRLAPPLPPFSCMALTLCPLPWLTR